MHADSTVPANAADINELSENNHSEDLDVCDETDGILITFFNHFTLSTTSFSLLGSPHKSS